ncbi:MAG: hypothetical protein AB7Q81_18160 [Gammaproteobacteria bacterium]
MTAHRIREALSEPAGSPCRPGTCGDEYHVGTARTWWDIHAMLVTGGARGAAISKE